MDVAFNSQLIVLQLAQLLRLSDYTLRYQRNIKLRYLAPNFVRHTKSDPHVRQVHFSPLLVFLSCYASKYRSFSHLARVRAIIQALIMSKNVTRATAVARKGVPSTRIKYASRLVHKFSPTKRQVA